MADNLGLLRKVHVHLSALEIGGPTDMTPEGMQYAVDAALAKLRAGGWQPLDDDDHDIDISYDGVVFLVEAWVQM